MLLLAAAAAGSSAQTVPSIPAAASASETAPTAEAGRKTYVSSCTRCHGINMVVSSSAFYDLRTFPQAEKERFLRSVNKGLRAMPAWEGVLSPEQIESLWLYIGKTNGWSP